MTKRKIAIIAAVVASLVAAVFIFLFEGHIGADGPDATGWIGLIVLFPAIFLSGLLGPLLGPGAGVVYCLFAFLEFFGIFYFFLRLVFINALSNKTMQATAATPRS